MCFRKKWEWRSRRRTFARTLLYLSLTEWLIEQDAVSRSLQTRIVIVVIVAVYVPSYEKEEIVLPLFSLSVLSFNSLERAAASFFLIINKN